MKQLAILFGLLICLVMVNARHYGDRHADETLENEEETLRPREHNLQLNRHRRRRWQSSYGYDYPLPAYPFPDRRDYDRNQQDVLQNIYRLLEEISATVRRPPPPPPQPVYIPYPVPYPFPQIPQVRVSCVPQNNANKTNVTFPNRASDMEDTNQNWGLVVSNENDYDDGSDGARPISFDPIVPKQFMKRPSPQVEHGSVQESTTQAPTFIGDAPSAPAALAVPGMCNAAILSCCGFANNKTQQKQCFVNIGCGMTYDNSVCSPASIQKALNSFKMAYSPVN